MKNEQHHFNLVSRLKDETSVFVRPLHPGDKACMQAGYHCLSKRSRYYRFLHYQSLLSDEQLKYFTEIDYINGAIVDLGKKHDIPTPLNEMLVELIHSLEVK